MFRNAARRSFLSSRRNDARRPAAESAADHQTDRTTTMYRSLRFSRFSAVALNPQPLPPMPAGAVALNPQPLPPRWQAAGIIIVSG